MKRLGLIGYPLGHSWSPEIHRFVTNNEYKLYSLPEEEMIRYVKEKQYDGLNVTIPYKERVIPYLDELDENAREIGAVNCIVNERGLLKGYNTDYLGFKQMILANHIDVKNKNVAILGTGGARKACEKALIDLGANIQVVSRKKEKGITYEELISMEKEISILVNTTPLGMKPNYDSAPVDLNLFSNLEVVIDIVANPLTTKLQFEAKMKKIPYFGGFEMLVRQAIEADKLFFREDYEKDIAEKCMLEIYKQKRNIVLIGMPTSGKTTLAKKLADITGNTLIEMDDELVKRFGIPIKNVFEKYGESYFREEETRLAKALREKERCIISCGGGVIKKEENMRYLNENGLIIWLDRKLEKLYGTSSRPLCKDNDAILNLYNERKDLYKKYADVVIENNGTIEEAIEKIMKVIGETEYDYYA